MGAVFPAGGRKCLPTLRREQPLNTASMHAVIRRFRSSVCDVSPTSYPGRVKVLFCASGVLKFGSGCLDWAFSLALDDPFLWRCSF